MIFARLTQRWHALRHWRGRQSLQSHGLFEESTFNRAYRDAIHSGAGLILWQQDGEHGRFALQLRMAQRDDANDGLTLSLLANGAILHRLSWTWVDGATPGATQPVVPLVAHNAGLWRDAGPAFDAFERAFPNNSPSFFAFAALQGAAQALGIDRVLALRATAHPSYRIDQHAAFESAYDGFWRILGGAEFDARHYQITLPFYLKPLADMPSKHRKRAAQRRAQWHAIGEAARATLLRHMAPVAAPVAVASARSIAQA
ncbi:DUF535 family protein [Massilia aurea]|uniref:DUF535 family protein n=1 Tax=Massilia aurea TaxID=373040 RepID=UPI003462363A